MGDVQRQTRGRSDRGDGWYAGDRGFLDDLEAEASADRQDGRVEGQPPGL